MLGTAIISTRGSNDLHDTWLGEVGCQGAQGFGVRLHHLVIDGSEAEKMLAATDCRPRLDEEAQDVGILAVRVEFLCRKRQRHSKRHNEADRAT